MNHAAMQLSSRSRYVQRTMRRYADLLDLLGEGIPTKATMEKTFFQLIGKAGPETGSSDRTLAYPPATALRILRQLMVHRLCMLNTQPFHYREGKALQFNTALEAVCRAMTECAEFAIEVAYAHALEELKENYGTPLRADGAECEMWVIGMGKLGARELNVSSDIDIIFIYQEEGETTGRADGRGRISNAEFFAKMVRMVSSMIGDVDEHGFVFRVDLALRPNGNSGPPAVSLASLERYFQVQGREWERFAWLKSRVIAPVAAVRSGSANALRGLVLPFVFRRYLDYAVFDSLRILHQQIRSHASKRAAGRPERANDVKLSRGGIREIEFIVQLLQVVRGGQFPELRTRPTLNALPRLAKAGLIPEDTAQQLASAYQFLRELEHRIQYLDDQQTHILPTDDGDLEAIAASLGFESVGDFYVHLGEIRETVAKEFDLLLGVSVSDDSPSEKGDKQCSSCNTEHEAQQRSPMEGFSALSPVAQDWQDWLAQRQERLTVTIESSKTEAAEQDRFAQMLQQWLDSVQQWSKGSRIVSIREEVRLRLMRLCAEMSLKLEEGSLSLLAAQRWLTWMETLVKRESYLALLIERPSVQERLLRLLGAAKWPLRFLTQYPGTIDELASDWMLRERFNPQTLHDELEARRESLRITQEDDEETLLNVLRRAHHAELLRTLVRDVEGQLTVEQVADDLSLLADTVLAVTARWCWDRLKQRHRDVPQFGIIGYGKLGGKELGYGSDLDIVFVFDDTHEQAQEIYSAFVRKLINWLSVKTGEGDLFEIDTALRPNGNSGLLVTSFSAYEKYQLSNGSNTAWTWEHQAITRARFVAGLPSLREQFESLRKRVICAPRDKKALRLEVLAMRERVRQAHPVSKGVRDVKHSVGAMVDAEFVVQYLVLAHAQDCPALQDNLGNIALLGLAEQNGLLPATLGAKAASAYRTLRQVQHQCRLNELPAQVSEEELKDVFEAIKALYDLVLQPQ